jgi:hypothetical protein
MGEQVRYKEGSRRPGNVHQHAWPGLGKKGQQQAIADWVTEGPAREAAYAKRGFKYIAVEDIDDFKEKKKQMNKDHPMLPAVPAMLTRSFPADKEHGTATEQDTD